MFPREWRARFFFASTVPLSFDLHTYAALNVLQNTRFFTFTFTSKLSRAFGAFGANKRNACHPHSRCPSTSAKLSLSILAPVG